MNGDPDVSEKRGVPFSHSNQIGFPIAEETGEAGDARAGARGR